MEEMDLNGTRDDKKPEIKSGAMVANNQNGYHNRKFNRKHNNGQNYGCNNTGN